MGQRNGQSGRLGGVSVLIAKHLSVPAGQRPRVSGQAGRASGRRPAVQKFSCSITPLLPLGGKKEWRTASRWQKRMEDACLFAASPVSVISVHKRYPRGIDNPAGTVQDACGTGCAPNLYQHPLVISVHANTSPETVNHERKLSCHHPEDDYRSLRDVQFCLESRHDDQSQTLRCQQPRIGHVGTNRTVGSPRATRNFELQPSTLKQRSTKVNTHNENPPFRATQPYGHPITISP
jgi:hypothetical protein